MTRAVLIGLALAAAAPAAGQTLPTSPVRLAFLNTRAVLEGTPGYAVADSTLKTEVEQARQEIRRMQAQLDSAVQVFDQQSIALSPAARSQKQRELQQMQQQLEERGTNLQERILPQRQRELLQPIEARIKAVIDGLRAELNLSLILDTGPGNGVISYDPALDITARVIERLRQAQ